MRFLFTLFLCGSLISSLSAQLPQGFFLPFGFNFTHQQVMDRSLSPVSYSGPLGGMNLGLIYQNKQWLSQLDISGAGAWQYPDVNREQNRSETLSILARAHYSLQYHLAEKNDFHLWAGLISHNLWDYRNHNRYRNSRDNYLGLFSAGPIVTIQKPLNALGQHFLAQTALAVPVASYYLRPGYVKPYTNLEIGAKDFAYWGQWVTLDWKTEVAWLFANENQLRLAYQWEYASLQQPNPVQVASHRLLLNFVFAF